MEQQALPKWALQRVAGVLVAAGPAGMGAPTAEAVARRTGMSAGLARRCVKHLRRLESESDHRDPARCILQGRGSC